MQFEKTPNFETFQFHPSNFQFDEIYSIRQLLDIKSDKIIILRTPDIFIKFQIYHSIFFFFSKFIVLTFLFYFIFSKI